MVDWQQQTALISFARFVLKLSALKTQEISRNALIANVLALTCGSDATHADKATKTAI